MRASIVTFDYFTDIDVFFMWDLLNRVRHPGWRVSILGAQREHFSSTGIRLETHGPLEEANDSEVVLFTSGQGARRAIEDERFVSAFRLDPGRQLIGSMCSGALILARLGLLEGKRATTYPTAVGQLRAMGVEVVEEPFVREGNVATAAGCLAAQYLVGWVIEEKLGAAERRRALRMIQPVGEGLSFDDYEGEAGPAAAVAANGVVTV
ncbi:MAG TPA: DJ-1/PfpI family protein [Pyrinomonadaceae bacterium]|nr:DJ-1/PfpI family protein [Pyrinomonadaceae bacterium]